ncbi:MULTISPECIES: hypothetical protein [Chryseobacterium]|uniref:Uncharacterized protein n=1 Tax=Chryseobacterium geocarposphaerae TaxID=1416776 RepID=A0A2M9C8L5_9FLAO|nr:MULTISPECIES: hypothetical protein [Chryseobacterium]PJJ67156.1 hypothetical protein CLV73_1155 [Chryseobacterium geocarposphaerae]UMQ42898.1 hypothetical protein MKS83_04225 [Chryseobacterium sp. Y16C]
MKKTFLSAIIASIFCAVISCSTERTSLASIEDMKSTEMSSFDKALKDIMKPENLSTPEEKARLGAQLNDRALNILFNASLKLTGKNGNNNLSENSSRVEKEQVIVKATELYFSKLNAIKAKQKAEN